MTFGLLLPFGILFYELFLVLKIVPDARSVLTESRRGMSVVAAKDLADEDKETIVRQASLSVLRSTIAVAGKFVLIGVLMYALFRGIVAIFPGREAALADNLASTFGIVVLTLATLVYAWLRGSVKRRLGHRR